MDFECPKCEKEFEGPFPYGDDVKCPHCRIWLSTEMEEDYDGLNAWITGISNNQTQTE